MGDHNQIIDEDHDFEPFRNYWLDNVARIQSVQTAINENLEPWYSRFKKGEYSALSFRKFLGLSKLIYNLVCRLALY